MPKPAPKTSATQQASKPSLGISPSAALKRNSSKKEGWCPKSTLELDPLCDPNNPKTITHRDVTKALAEIRDRISNTMLLKSRHCDKFGFELYYKIETLHKTGSASERGAYYALKCLTSEQQDSGVVTASFGNFGLALAYHARKLNIRARIVFPKGTPEYFIDKCQEFKGRVTVVGETLLDAKKQACVLASELDCVYINGYDHPGVIAGLGTIGLEIMEDLPEVDVVLVPVGGGALLAGIAAAVKHTRPNAHIYGVEPINCCSFYKAMEKDGVFETEPGHSMAGSLGISMPGHNSYCTAKPFIDKMILIEDDWISRAVLHFVEEEKMVVEPAGATALSALMATPDLLPELNGKVVVCVISGSNIPALSFLTRCMDRGRALEGRLVNLTMTLWADAPNDHLHAMSMIANTGCNVIQCHLEHAWITDNDLRKYKLQMVIETRDLEHAAQLKRVMQKLYPDKCEFYEEPFNSVPICACFPKKKSK